VVALGFERLQQWLGDAQLRKSLIRQTWFLLHGAPCSPKAHAGPWAVSHAHREQTEFFWEIVSGPASVLFVRTRSLARNREQPCPLHDHRKGRCQVRAPAAWLSVTRSRCQSSGPN
jgi:hypothetical protein